MGWRGMTGKGSLCIEPRMANNRYLVFAGVVCGKIYSDRCCVIDAKT